MRFEWTMTFHLDTAGPAADTNPACGVWLLGRESDRPRKKKMWQYGWRKGSKCSSGGENIKWAELGKRNRKRKQTSNRTILQEDKPKFYVQQLRSSFLTTVKPLLFGALPFWWIRVAYTDSTWYPSFITPSGTIYSLYRSLGSQEASNDTMRAVCNLCLSQCRGFLPYETRALTGPRPHLLSGHKHIWTTDGHGLAERKLASGTQIMPTSHSHDQDLERWVSFFFSLLSSSILPLLF